MGGKGPCRVHPPENRRRGKKGWEGRVGHEAGHLPKSQVGRDCNGTVGSPVLLPDAFPQPFRSGRDALPLEQIRHHAEGFRPLQVRRVADDIERPHANRQRCPVDIRDFSPGAGSPDHPDLVLGRKVREMFPSQHLEEKKRQGEAQKGIDHESPPVVQTKVQLGSTPDIPTHGVFGLAG
jgi:hypothetical protein